MEKVKVVGSVLCPDTLLALCKLKDADVALDFHNITGTMQELKEYLRLRDTEPMFEQAKAEGRVGIPFFVLPDGTKTWQWQEVLTWAQNHAEKA